VSDIVVVSGAYTTHPGQWRIYRESCARHGVPLSVLGEGQSFDAMKALRAGADFLLHRPEKYALVSCAYDVLVSRWSEAEVIRWTDMAGGLLMSCEGDCWPAGEWCAAYTNHTTPWFAINGGQYCGERLKIVQLLNVIASRLDSATMGGGSQEVLHMLYSEGYGMALDNNCRVFQSMSGSGNQYVVPRDKLAYNTVTATYPMFLHFNGRTPGMEQWEKALA
jgi:hypothetical protein